MAVITTQALMKGRGPAQSWRGCRVLQVHLLILHLSTSCHSKNGTWDS